MSVWDESFLLNLPLAQVSDMCTSSAAVALAELTLDQAIIKVSQDLILLSYINKHCVDRGLIAGTGVDEISRGFKKKPSDPQGIFDAVSEAIDEYLQSHNREPLKIKYVVTEDRKECDYILIMDYSRAYSELDIMMASTRVIANRKGEYVFRTRDLDPSFTRRTLYVYVDR